MRRAEISATSILDKYILLSLLVLVLVDSMPKYYGFSCDQDLAIYYYFVTSSRYCILQAVVFTGELGFYSG